MINPRAYFVEPLEPDKLCLVKVVFRMHVDKKCHIVFKDSLSTDFISRPNSQKAQKRLGEFPPGSGLGTFGLGTAASKVLNFLGGSFIEYFVNSF